MCFSWILYLASAYFFLDRDTIRIYSSYILSPIAITCNFTVTDEINSTYPTLTINPKHKIIITWNSTACCFFTNCSKKLSCVPITINTNSFYTYTINLFIFWTTWYSSVYSNSLSVCHVLMSIYIIERSNKFHYIHVASFFSFTI